MFTLTRKYRPSQKLIVSISNTEKDINTTHTKYLPSQRRLDVLVPNITKEKLDHVIKTRLKNTNEAGRE